MFCWLKMGISAGHVLKKLGGGVAFCSTNNPFFLESIKMEIEGNLLKKEMSGIYIFDCALNGTFEG
jgi:hypothetical protein